MQQLLYHLFVLTEKELYRFLLHVLAVIAKLLHQVFIHRQHLRLVYQQNDLDQHVIYQSECHLLVVLVAKRSDVDPHERIHLLLVGKTVRVVRTPSELDQRLTVVDSLGHKSIRLVVLKRRVVLPRVPRHVEQV